MTQEIFCRKTFIIVTNYFNLDDQFLRHLDVMKASQLYKFLKNIPKSVLQHNHFNCNEDFDFYKNYIISDPNLYLNKSKNQFHYGTQKEATEREWVSLAEFRKGFESDNEFI